MTHEGLDYRRQFLLAPTTCPSLRHWNHRLLGSHHLMTHPDLEVSSIATENDVELTLIGYMIDPKQPKSSNRDILHNLLPSFSDDVDDDSLICSLTGRFILIVQNHGKLRVYHDPCGLRSVYYIEDHGNLYLGSQPNILGEVFELRKEARFGEYESSKHRRINQEHWLPSGVSLYEGVNHLVPNHYLKFPKLSQVRYWPNKRLEVKPLEQVIPDICGTMSDLMQSANERFPLALPLTAGWDSRMILAASHNIIDEVYCYTLQYRTLNIGSPDIAIPSQLLAEANLSHHIIDCRISPDSDFSSIYQNNSSMSHLDDWGTIAYGMSLGYPKDRVAVKGNCAEIGRCFFQSWGIPLPVKSHLELLELIEGWNELSFIRDQIELWFLSTKPIADAFGYDILDLFYWEHRMGSWQSQSQQEWDIVQEAFTPFNHRGLLELMLSTPVEARMGPSFPICSAIIRRLWPELLSLPVNPPQ